MTEGYTEFEFDLPGALLARLVTMLDTLPAAQLAAGVVNEIPDEQGVYQLFLDGPAGKELVYIGKTDAAAGLQMRLSRHAEKIQQRVGLNPARVFFKAVRIYVFTAVDLETQLIGHYGGVQKVSWNGSGFGSNDPGRERDTTKYKPDHFDAMYPIDISRPLAFSLPTKASAAEILRTLKSNLPFLIRFEVVKQGSRTAHAELEGTTVTLDPRKPMTAESVLAQTIPQLPPGWHVTKLPSHVIIYKNDDRKFPSGTTIARS
ncbi:GIY-YIG nuclease family protein [Rhodoblastus sp.]|uniref:GIY-YIG nuclease family protein n=1 Tax=Rhodoblastus sp. TaxID=1962975 RepID=UPI003F9CAAB5